jgi:hypothetical protein
VANEDGVMSVIANLPGQLFTAHGVDVCNDDASAFSRQYPARCGADTHRASCNDHYFVCHAS